MVVNLNSLKYCPKYYIASVKPIRYHNRTMKAMKIMNKKSIMIVTPPLTSPAMPSFTGAFAAGCFSPEDFNVVIYDANLDFFTNHVFSKRVLEIGFKAFVQNKKKSLISNKDFRVLEKVFQSLSFQPFSTEYFRSESFYDPEKYLVARNRIDDLLFLYSAGFYPSRIRWNFLSGSIVDDNNNPLFISFYYEKFGLMLKQALPETVIIALDSESQISPSNTMIKYIKTNFPEIQTIVLQEKYHAGNNTPDPGQIFSLQNQSLFLKWINTTWKCDNGYSNIEPDFSMFPLKEYLAPELILPIQADFFKDSLSLGDFVAKLNDKFGAKGFFFNNLLFSFEIFLKIKNPAEFFFGIQTDMEDYEKMSDNNKNQNIFSSGTTLVQWKNPGKKDPYNIKDLWDISKQGIWNHVELTGTTGSEDKKDWLRFISLNPNIAHSYENSAGPGPYGKSNLNGMDHSLKAYSGVKKLVGQPFWNFLSDPVHLLLYLKHHGKKNLFCLRADKINETIISLGSDINFYYRKPDDLPPGFLDEICAMVEAGGSVDTKYVRYNLERAYLIGYAQENGIIVGNSSLKHPRDEFIKRLDTITGLDFKHFVERGYTSVRPEYRALGVGARLLKGLTKRAGQYKIFSIISEDNTATHKIAKKNKTKKIAVYYSKKAGKELGIWMPGHMIEKDWKLKL
jgi:hypothetical protein